MERKKFVVKVDLESGEVECSHFDINPKKRQQIYNELQQELFDKVFDKKMINAYAIAAEIMITFIAPIAMMDADTYKTFVKYSDVIREYKYKQATNGFEL